MSNARMASEFVKHFANAVFPNDAKGMSKHVVDYLTFADIKDRGTHKYIPADELSAKLGLPEGAGVYGYIRFQDCSYILLTCHAGIAHWDGEGHDPVLVFE